MWCKRVNRLFKKIKNNSHEYEKESIIHCTKRIEEAALGEFATKWECKFSYVIQSWRNNQENLTVFFEFPVEIRKIIYTTNLIENLNGKIRKYTKNKLSFPTDEAVMKSIYLFINAGVHKKNGLCR